MRDQQFIKIAQDRCCNIHNSGCLGAVFYNDLTTKCLGEKKICLILDNRHCQFFEECVLPGVPDNALELVAAYKARFNSQPMLGKYRECPTCGTRLEPKHRYCAICLRKRTKINRRNSKRSSHPTPPNDSSDTLTCDSDPLNRPLSDPKRRQGN
jgi:hypothetical protein